MSAPICSVCGSAGAAALVRGDPALCIECEGWPGEDTPARRVGSGKIVGHAGLEAFAQGPPLPTVAERDERLHKSRDTRALDALHWLIVDLSAFLADESDDLTPAGLDTMRRRVANALPPTRCPEWLAEFRDPPIVKSC